MTVTRGLALLVMLLLAVACEKEKPAQTEITVPSTSSTAVPAFTPYPVDASKIETVTPGLRIYFHEKGTGRLPKAGERVIVNYHGTFEDGRIFDSSFNRGVPFDFVLGKGQVIRGWDEGFQRLPIGSKAVLLLSPEFGYGAAGSGPIPPNTPLVFHVEVLGTSQF